MTAEKGNENVRYYANKECTRPLLGKITSISLLKGKRKERNNCADLQLL